MPRGDVPRGDVPRGFYMHSGLDRYSGFRERAEDSTPAPGPAARALSAPAQHADAQSLDHKRLFAQVDLDGFVLAVLRQ